MTFLQSQILYALPLILLPIVIHLINQNRHKTVQWAATMFLLQAKRMVRGMAKLRYVLILIARMLAVAGLLLAISRPMSGGWLGLAGGGAPELTVIILDRSASMELQDPQSGLSRRDTALEKVSGLFRDLGRNARTVLFDTATGRHIELTDATSLAELSETSSTATAADLSSTLQSAAEFITTSEAGRTDVWVCSDLQRSGWQPASGRWKTIREQLANREGLRLYLLLYGDDGPENLAVEVSNVSRRETDSGAELLMDIDVRQTSGVITDQTRRIPLSLVINGARSAFEVDLTSGVGRLGGHAIPVDRDGGQDVSALKRVLRSLAEGKVMILFPEGTRSPDGRLQEPKAGVGFILCKTQVPVVPARIFGSFEAFGRGTKFPQLGTKVDVVFGPPLAPTVYDVGTGKERYQVASTRIMDAVAKLELPPEHLVRVFSDVADRLVRRDGDAQHR